MRCVVFDLDGTLGRYLGRPAGGGECLFPARGAGAGGCADGVSWRAGDAAAGVRPAGAGVDGSRRGCGLPAAAGGLPGRDRDPYPALSRCDGGGRGVEVGGLCGLDLHQQARGAGRSSADGAGGAGGVRGAGRGGYLPGSQARRCSLPAAVERAGGVVTRSMLVGDTETDAKTGVAAGVPVALVTFGPEGGGWSGSSRRPSWTGLRICRGWRGG
jgi:hypothetical protein